MMWARSGVSFDEYSADADQCSERARVARNSVPTQSAYSSPSSGTAGALGAAFGAGLARGLAQGQAMRAAYESCYQEHGYTQVPVPEQEVRAMRAAPREGEARVRTFYDIATRFAPASLDADRPRPPEAPIEETPIDAALPPEPPAPGSAESAQSPSP
jgi:hypothetical protein